MIDCPKCGTLVNGLECGHCGYGKTNAKGKSQDPDWWRCADVKFGARCGKPGALSHSTHGGGPWYCRDHFGRTGAVLGAVAPTGVFQSIRESLTQKGEA